MKMKTNITWLLLFSLMFFLQACSTTPKLRYAVHNFQLTPEANQTIPLTQHAVLMVSAPLLATQIDGAKLDRKVIFRDGRTFDMFELSDGAHSLKVQYRNTVLPLKGEFKKGFFYIVRYETAGEALANLGGNQGKAKILTWIEQVPQSMVDEKNGVRITINKNAAGNTDNFFYTVKGPDFQKEYNFSSIRRSQPIFSGDKKRVAFSYKDGEKWSVVVDGQEGKQYKNVFSLIFSKDGSRFAYIAEQESQSFAVVDGVEQKHFDHVQHIVFSQDGKRLAYIARIGEKKVVVCDDKTAMPFDDIYGISFSADGSDLYYLAQKDNKFALVRNGQVGPLYDLVDSLTLSGSRYGYRAIMQKGGREPDRVTTVIDGVEGPYYDLTWELLPLLGHRLAKEDITPLYKEYPDISVPYFSPDGQTVLYTAEKVSLDTYKKKIVSSEKYVVVNGKQSRRYEAVEKKPFFSKTSQHYGYTAADVDPSCKQSKYFPTPYCNQWFHVINGVEGQKYQHVSLPVFSQDGSKIAYALQKKDVPYWLVNVNGVELPRLFTAIKTIEFIKADEVIEIESVAKYVRKTGFEMVKTEFAIKDVLNTTASQSGDDRTFYRSKIEFFPDKGPKYDGPVTIPAGKGVIYFYRPSHFAGSAAQMSVGINHTKGYDSIPLVNGTYYPYICEPGEVQILSPRNIHAVFNVEAGKTYYFKGETGFSGGQFVVMEEKEALSDLKSCDQVIVND